MKKVILIIILALGILGCKTIKSIKEVRPIYGKEPISLNITMDTFLFKNDAMPNNLLENSNKPSTRKPIRQVEDLIYQYETTIGETISYDDDNMYIQRYGREHLLFSSNVCESNSPTLCAPSFIIHKEELYTVSLSKDCKEYTIKNIPNFQVTNTYVGKIRYVPDDLAFSASPSIAKIGQTLYFPVTAYGVLFKKNKSFYKIGSYDLDNNKFKLLPIPVPDFYQKSHIDLQNVFDLLKSTSNDLIVAYTMRPLGYVFNIEKNEIINTFSFKSQYDTLDLLVPEKGEDNINTMINTMRKSIFYDGYYRNFTYNKHKKHYYCVYQIGQPEHRDDGVKNTLEDRNSSFIVLNEDLEIINETLMLGVKGTIRIFTTKEGAFFITGLSEVERLKNPNHAVKVNITYD